MRFEGIEKRKDLFETQIKAEESKLSDLHAIKGIRRYEEWRLVTETSAKRMERLSLLLTTTELSPYEQGKAQGEIKVLRILTADDRSLDNMINSCLETINRLKKGKKSLPDFS
jgi:hypothetical protein